jgi:hypothetical protein
MGIGRGRAICKLDELMCKSLPGSSNDARLINATAAFCNIARPAFARAYSVLIESERGSSLLF